MSPRRRAGVPAHPGGPRVPMADGGHIVISGSGEQPPPASSHPTRLSLCGDHGAASQPGQPGRTG